MSNHCERIFSTLDKAVLRMVMKGAWVYDAQLDVKSLKESFGKLLGDYPFLCGRFNGKDGIKYGDEITPDKPDFVCGVPFRVRENLGITVSQVAKDPKILENYSSKLDLSLFKKGEIAPINVCLTCVSDGCVLGVQCAHVCFDGHSFFELMQRWSYLCTHKSVNSLVLDQALAPKQSAIAKDQLIARVIEKGWKKLGLKDLLKMFFFMSKSGKNCSAHFYIPYSQIEEIKEDLRIHKGCHVGTHAIISAILMDKMRRLKTKNIDKPFTLVTVTDMRGRIPSIPEHFVGNSVTNVVIKSLRLGDSISELAYLIHKELADYLSNQDGMLEDLCQLSIDAIAHTIPYVGFDVVDMNGQYPTTLYINNFVRFPIYDVDFGTGKPYYVAPNDLPDTIKIFPTKDGDGVEAILRGYFAKEYQRVLRS